jgi:hypothetical protein
MFITHKDLIRLFNCSQQAAKVKLTRIKKKLGLFAYQSLTLRLLCSYLGIEESETKKALGWK